MARTKAEVRAFLDSKVGHTCTDKSNADLNGQCVSLIKNLMDFLGVPNPYGARGNAKDAGDIYIAQGIGTSGRGWLTICVNRDMGGGYGHIWVDLAGEANYESNGARALVTTKNTRPISQGQQFINFDKWITGESTAMIIQNEDNWYGRFRKAMLQIRGRDLGREEFNKNFVGVEVLTMLERLSDDPEAARAYEAQTVGQLAIKDNWQGQIYSLQDALKKRPTEAQLVELQAQAAKLAASAEAAEKARIAAEAKAKQLENQAHIDYEAGKSIFRRIGIMLGLIKE